MRCGRRQCAPRRSAGRHTPLTIIKPRKSTLTSADAVFAAIHIAGVEGTCKLARSLLGGIDVPSFIRDVAVWRVVEAGLMTEEDARKRYDELVRCATDLSREA